MYWSIVYCIATAVLFFLRMINANIANGKKREFEWTDEVIVITGGSSGLGLLIAEVYGMRGVSVAVLDVGDKKQVAEALAKVKEELGTPTVLINNAAVCQGKSILDLSIDEIEETIKTNVLGSFYTVKEVLPGMITEGRGTIVTIGSVLAHIGPKKLCKFLEGCLMNV
jgi:NADP-dependent 3-hydroxy acid dehydrogenase YdfG